MARKSLLRGGRVFKGLGNLGNIQGLVRQALDMKGKIEEMKAVLGKERIEASSGGGMVTVVLTGQFELLSIKIEPEIINPDDPEMLETMIRSAINEAVRKTQELVKQKMTELTGGIEIPGLT
jgi:nucleoid-associated protein EbfC